MVYCSTVQSWKGASKHLLDVSNQPWANSNHGQQLTEWVVIISGNPTPAPLCDSSLSPFYRWGNWVFERLSKVAAQDHGRPQVPGKTICQNLSTSIEVDRGIDCSIYSKPNRINTWWGGSSLLNESLQNLTKPTTDILNVMEKSYPLYRLSPGKSY